MSNSEQSPLLALTELLGAGPEDERSPGIIAKTRKSPSILRGSLSALASSHRNLQFLLLVIATSAAVYAWSAISPLQEAIHTALSLDDNEMAALQGPARALPMAIAAVPIGLLIDRWSRVRLLFVFALLDLAGSLLTAAAPNFTGLFLARSLVGLSVSGINATVFSLLADLCAPAVRGRAMMIVAIGQYFGMSAAFALGGALLELSGTSPPVWRWAMLWLVGPLVLMILFMFAMREPSRTGIAMKLRSPRDSFIELWQYRSVILPLIAGLATADMASAAVLTWAAPTLSRTFALPPGRIGAILGMTVLASGVLGPIAGGILADFCQRSGGPRRTISALGVLSVLGVPSGVFALLPNVPLVSVLLIIFTTVMVAVLVVGTTLLTIVIPNELRGICLSLSSGVQLLLGIAFAPLIISLLSTALGGPEMIGTALALVCVAVSLIGATIFALARSSFPRSAASPDGPKSEEARSNA